MCMKQFKTKKLKKRRKIILIIFIFFFFFSYVFMIKFCISNKLDKNILNSKYNYIKFDVKKIISNEFTENINKPVNLLNKNVKSAVKIETKKTTVSEKKAQLEKPVLQEEKEEKPIIYVYNTHQTEKYANYSVYEAAVSLSQKLTQKGYLSYFEEQSVSVFLQNNNFKYHKSYTASRKYMDDARSKYTSLNYFFDIHRDSVSKEKSTLIYQKKNYAKVLFVVGTDNPNNEKNKNSTTKLNEIIKSKVPGISRGIMYHGGSGYNGVYNQDVSENVFLIEVGGKDNTKEEVENTINVIYESIIEYIGLI